MFTAFGVPPDASINLMVVLQYVKFMVAVMLSVWLFRYRRAMHLRLRPHDQYRLHLEAGGYRPL